LGASSLTEIFKPANWHNVPKVVLETVEALVAQIESNRL
jgi:hypothetical protein